MATRWRHLQYWLTISLPDIGSPCSTSCDGITTHEHSKPHVISTAGSCQYLAVKMVANTDPAGTGPLAQGWPRPGWQGGLGQGWHARAGPTLASSGPSLAKAGPDLLLLTRHRAGIATTGPELAWLGKPPTPGPMVWCWLGKLFPQAASFRIQLVILCKAVTSKNM
jgi:hypothetical protein